MIGTRNHGRAVKEVKIWGCSGWPGRLDAKSFWKQVLIG